MAIRMPGFDQGISTPSGVFAKERIVENGRLIYAKGDQIRVEDVERLGLGKAKPAAEKTQTPASAKRQSRTAAASRQPVVDPPAPKKRAPRGSRRRTAPKEEGS